MTNSKANGVFCLANPYGLTWGENSGKHMQVHDDKLPSYRFIRFNDDGVSISVAGHTDGLHFWYDTKYTHIERFELNIVSSGDKFLRDGMPHLSVKGCSLPYLNASRVSHIKNLLPGQVLDVHTGQIVVMPTPSEDPIIQCLYEHGLQASNMVVTFDYFTESANFRKNCNNAVHYGDGFGPSICVDLALYNQGTWKERLGVKFCMTPDARKSLKVETLQSMIQVKEKYFPEYTQKSAWLLVAEMNLAENLGPAIIDRERVLRFIQGKIHFLAAKCHPLVQTENHLQNVANFTRSDSLCLDRFKENGFNKLPEAIDDLVWDAVIRIEKGGDIDTSDDHDFTIKKISDEIYHVHMKSVEHHGATHPLFSINKNDWNEMVEKIEKEVK